MSRSRPTAPATVSSLALVPGALWSVALFVALGFGPGPHPETGGQYAILLFLSLFVGLFHGALLATSASLLGRSPWGRRLPRGTDAALALVAGSVYAYLALSLAKFGRTGAHLRFEDLWFLATSPLQAAGEGTATERFWLVAAALAPLLLAILVYALLRGARGSPPGAAEITPAAGLGLAAVAALGLAAVLVAHPAGRWAAATLLPDTSAVARTWNRLRETRGTSEWRPDPLRQARLDADRAAAAPRPWNVVVVLLESVSWSRLEGPAARSESTPRLLELARESVRFESASATSSHSDYAQTSILSSLYPRKGEAHDYFTELDYPRALPWDVLGPRGWRSAVFSTQNEQWGNMLAFLRTPRLEQLRHAPDFPDAPHRGDGSETKLFEETVVREFLVWLREDSERPFVAYLNFQATHYPYVWPPGFEPPYGAAAIDFPTTFLDYPRERTPLMLDRFHNALAYVDLWTGRLLDGLRAAGVWESTALVVVSDHGEAFHEHGLVTHGTTLLEEQLRVPMWIRLPGAEPRLVTEPVTTLDALPAVYRAMGVPRHPALQGDDTILDAGYTAAGRPLFATLQGMTREDAILADGWKWIVNHDRREGALFDLRGDPLETRNLVLAEPARRAALDAALARFLADQVGYYRARAWRSGWGPPRLPSTLAAPATPPLALPAGSAQAR